MKKKQRRDLYAEVTETIAAALETGTAPWVKPWKADPSGLGGAHHNGVSRSPYRGVNVLLLMIAADARGYSSGDWYTYLQAQRLGAQVRHEEKATTVVFWKIFRKEEEDPETGEKEEVTIPMLRHHSVFNRDQIDGLPPLPVPEEKEAPEGVRSFPIAETIVSGSGARITHGGDRACFSPASDCIMLPRPEAFEDAGAYWATAFHELMHWTGPRLSRDLSGRFGSEAYALEELVAELGSAFLSRIAELDGKLQHPEYLATWAKVLRADHRAIFSASSQAQKGSDFLLRAAGLLEEDGEDGEQGRQAA